MKKSRELVIVAFATLLTIGAGCAKKKVAAAPPPPPPEPTRSAPAAPMAATTPRPRPAPEVAATPQSHYPNAVTRARIDELLARIEDAYFDYDQAHAPPGRHQGAAG